MTNHHRSLFSLWLVTALLLSTENATAQGQGCGGVRERWAWTDHTCEEQDAFLEAVWGMKQSGVYDQFVNVHTQMNRAAHGNAEFLPWHRWFIYQFEQALQEESGNPCMTLPFWDWEDTSVFDEDTFDWFDGFEPENPRRCRWTLPNGQCLQRQRNRNVQLWRTGRTMGIMTNFRQYGDDFLARNPNRNNGFRAAFEGGPHTAPHTQIGGPMAGPLSASDPLFFVHHANVDRIWSLWQDFHDHDEVDKEDFRAPIHYEGGRLDRPMPFANHPRFRNGRNFPTPRDLLSNNDIVNVIYKNDQLVSRMGYNPNPRWAERATWGNQIWCDRRRFQERKNRRELHIGKRFEDRVVDRQELDQKGRVREKQKNPPFARLGLRGGNHGGSNKRNKLVGKEIYSMFNSFVSVDQCREYDLPDQTEKGIWDQQCQEISLNTSLADRMALLAQEECSQLHNPVSAGPDYIRAAHMENELATFECFRLPDDIE